MATAMIGHRKFSTNLTMLFGI